MNTPFQRREFLGKGMLAGVGFWVASSSARAGSKSPNEKLNIGIIGAGGRGVPNTKAVSSENIVALCDVDERHVAKAAKEYPKAKTYVDWRKLLDQKDLDAVVCSTTDHTHAPISVWAMRRGLSVYTEKPLAHSVHEARVVQETYKKHKGKLATQMGTQAHANDNLRRVVELIQSGAIGPVREVHVWCGRVGACPERPKEEHPVPEYLHWDFWLGPAPWRPYHSSYLPGCVTWEQRWDFGNGALGDMGSHQIDVPFWALKLRDPLTVEAEGDVRSQESYPHWLKVHWEHPARGDMPPLRLHWYDGGKRPELSPEIKWANMLFTGDEGTLAVSFGRHLLLPEEKFKDFQPPDPWIPSAPGPHGHHQEWIQGCKTGSPTLCNFDYSGKLVEHNLLGTVAFRVGKKLTWDPENLKAVGCPEADQYIRRQYREGWTLEG